MAIGPKQYLFAQFIKSCHPSVAVQVYLLTESTKKWACIFLAAFRETALFSLCPLINWLKFKQELIDHIRKAQPTSFLTIKNWCRRPPVNWALKNWNSTTFQAIWGDTGSFRPHNLGQTLHLVSYACEIIGFFEVSLRPLNRSLSAGPYGKGASKSNPQSPRDFVVRPKHGNHKYNPRHLEQDWLRVVLARHLEKMYHIRITWQERRHTNFWISHSHIMYIYTVFYRRSSRE